VFADWLIGSGQKVGGYQITLPNPAGAILDSLPCRLQLYMPDELAAINACLLEI
jgi:hypothetical protein